MILRQRPKSFARNFTAPIQPPFWSLFPVLQLVSEPVKDHSSLIGPWSMKATWSVVPANRRSSMEQTTPTGRSACLRIFRALTGEFGRFVNIPIMRCLLLVSVRSRLTNTMQITGLVVFSFWAFRFRSLSGFQIVLLLERSRWGFKVITREPHKSKPDSLRCTSVSMRTCLSWMESLSMPCFLTFYRLWTRCGQTSRSCLMMIMRGLSSYYMP